MRDIRIRCHALGKLMTEPRSKAEGPLSVGAKTYIRQLVTQDLFGVDFEISSKYMEKGIRVEGEAIEMLNRVRGLSLAKNTERRTNDWITGEADLFDINSCEGHDLKSSWSIQTFPICVADCIDREYEWQMRGYMMLWDAPRWHVDYALVDTPDDLVGNYEPMHLHFVGHIPERLRITSWTIERDSAKEAAIVEKVKHARAYWAEVVEEFEETHRALEAVA